MRSRKDYKLSRSEVHPWALSRLLESKLTKDHDWLCTAVTGDSSVASLTGDGETEWWTFGGSRANATLARELAQETGGKVDFDSFTLTFESATKLQDVKRAIGEVRGRNVTEMRPAVDEAAMDGLKFSECLPIELAAEMLERRLQDQEATRRTLVERVRFLVQQ